VSSSKGLLLNLHPQGVHYFLFFPFEVVSAPQSTITVFRRPPATSPKVGFLASCRTRSWVFFNEYIITPAMVHAVEIWSTD